MSKCLAQREMLGVLLVTLGGIKPGEVRLLRSAFPTMFGEPTQRGAACEWFATDRETGHSDGG